MKCPECGRSNVVRSTFRPEYDYQCSDCGVLFREGVGHWQVTEGYAINEDIWFIEKDSPSDMSTGD